MRQDIVIRSEGIKMRLIEKADAQFIVDIRTNKNLGQNISYTSSDINNQITWIEEYKKREAAKKEYYFIFEDSKNKRWGTVRLYNLNDKNFTLGSWICLPNNKENIAIKSWLLCTDFGFKQLNYKTCLFDVRKKNLRVLYFAYLFNPIKINEDELNFYFTLDRVTFYENKEKVLKFLDFSASK